MTTNNDDILCLISDLKSEMEKLIFGIASSVDLAILHKNSLELFTKISELNNIVEKHSFQNYDDLDLSRIALDIEQSPQHTEIIKVARRLKKWATIRGRTQVNSKILKCYLDLRKHCNEPITENLFKKAFGITSDKTEQFNRNFPQMKIIAPKNHGKIFDEKNGVITIWQPIEDFVNEYEIEVDIT